MSEVTIDLLGLLQGEQDVGDEILVEVGDLLNLGAQTGVRWLPAIFQEDSFLTLDRWTNEVRDRLRAAGVHTAIISADVYEDDDDRLQLELELQVTFVGPLPIQLDAEGEFYGYDEDGYLLTREQMWDRAIDDLTTQGGYGGTVGGRGPAFGWAALAVGVLAILGVDYGLTVSEAIVTKLVSPDAREPVREVSGAVKTVAAAAAIVALVYLLSKA